VKTIRVANEEVQLENNRQQKQLTVHTNTE